MTSIHVMAADPARLIAIEVIITEESPRFLEKQAPDSPIELHPIKVTSGL
jgi:hypothetical protein